MKLKQKLGTHNLLQNVESWNHETICINFKKVIYSLQHPTYPYSDEILGPCLKVWYDVIGEEVWVVVYQLPNTGDIYRDIQQVPL